MVSFKFLLKEYLKKLLKSAGVYCFKGKKEVFYIGKAVNIQERVKNHDKLLNQAEQVGYIKTGSEIEALILEANLIKKYQPKHNVVWRDDKNYFYIAITKEDFPKVFITHQIKSQKSKSKSQNYNQKPKTIYIGPFVDGAALKQTLKILRKAFPYRSCNQIPKKPCLWYQLNRCLAPCLLKSNLGKQIPKLKRKIEKECQENVKNIIKIFQGKKTDVLKNLNKEMELNAKLENFEKAAKIRNKIRVLERILANAKILESSLFLETDWLKTQKILQKILRVSGKISRIEAYDISNIQGKQAAGSMVTFIDGLPNKNFYRKFRIKIAEKPNDVAMLKEILSRRLKHTEWPYPDLILIDGGKAQLNATLRVINQRKSVKSASISVLTLAKKQNNLFIEGRKKPILLKNLPREIFNLILQLRDEAHRFAIAYHKKLRYKNLLKS